MYLGQRDEKDIIFAIGDVHVLATISSDIFFDNLTKDTNPVVPMNHIVAWPYLEEKIEVF